MPLILIIVGYIISVATLGAQPSADDCGATQLLDVSKFAGAGDQYAKPRVEGVCEGDDFVIRSNGIPHYEFVQITPNPLTEQKNEIRVPRHPKIAEEPTSIPFLGTTGIAVNGIVLYGPNEGPVPAVERFGDPIFNAIMDECMGHTADQYHYHALNQLCLTDGVKEGAPSPVLGYALDGFAIRGPLGCADANCSEVIRYESSWEMTGDPAIKAWEAYKFVEKDDEKFLDRCNGHSAPDGNYHYHATATFPYILGCYAGSPNLPERSRVSGNRGPRGGRPGGPGGRGVGRRRGPGGAPAGAGRRRFRPGDLASAAARLSVGEEDLAAVIDQEKLVAYLRDPENQTFDYAAAARELHLNEEVLRQALEHQIPTPLAYKGHRPGCTTTPEGYLLCHPNAVHHLVDQVQRQPQP
jgi:hypothetical protein